MSKSLRYKILLLLLCGAMAARGDQYDPRLGLDRHIDALLWRLSSRYDIGLPPAMSLQPLRLRDIRTVLLKADSLQRTGALSPWETYRLQKLLGITKNARSLFTWQDRDTSRSLHLSLELQGSLAPSVAATNSIAVQGLIRPGLTGHIGGLSYYSSVDVWTDYTSDSLFKGSSYEPYDGIPYNLYGREDSSHFRSSDMVRGGIAYGKKWMDLEAAVDYLRQGPAVFYPLTFSGYTPPIMYLKAGMHLGPAQYFHTIGQLKHQKDKPKYLYTHRLQATVWDERIRFGISEVIVNGSTAEDIDSLDPHNALRRPYYGVERNWEWAYAIPFVPFKFIEHYLGDRDNGALSVDAEVRAPRCFRWYGEVFLDDISAPWTILSDDFGNKWAFTVGGQYFGSFKGADLTVTTEYSRIEPWVYTHFYGGSHRYTHFGRSLGSPLGPNSDALVADMALQFKERHAAGVRFSLQRKNKSARGGSIDHVFQDSSYGYAGAIIEPPNPDSEKKRFLGEGTTRSGRLGVTWTYAPFGLVRLDGAVEYEMLAEKRGFYVSLLGKIVFF